MTGTNFLILGGQNPDFLNNEQADFDKRRTDSIRALDEMYERFKQFGTTTRQETRIVGKYSHVLDVQVADAQLLQDFDSMPKADQTSANIVKWNQANARLTARYLWDMCDRITVMTHADLGKYPLHMYLMMSDGGGTSIVNPNLMEWCEMVDYNMPCQAYRRTVMIPSPCKYPTATIKAYMSSLQRCSCQHCTTAHHRAANELCCVWVCGSTFFAMCHHFFTRQVAAQSFRKPDLYTVNQQDTDYNTKLIDGLLHQALFLELPNMRRRPDSNAGD